MSGLDVVIDDNDDGENDLKRNDELMGLFLIGWFWWGEKKIIYKHKNKK